MRISIIEWVDSAFCQGWMNRDNAKSHKESRIVTVGILLFEDDERVTVMQSLSDKNDAGDGITIPKCSIKRMRQLNIKKGSLSFP